MSMQLRAIGVALALATSLAADDPFSPCWPG
jgi:hypothetical protein